MNSELVVVDFLVPFLGCLYNAVMEYKGCYTAFSLYIPPN